MDEPAPAATSAPNKDVGALTNTPVTRRDIISGTVVGTGAALLGMASPLATREAVAQTIGLPMTGLGPDWTGPSGIGDYAGSNGNTWEIVNAAHGGIRNQDQNAFLAKAVNTGETYDLIVVGGGVSGLSAMYTWHKERPDAKILNLDNGPIFGGESRRNELVVDDVHLYAPQGPQIFAANNVPRDFWPMAEELGIPEKFNWTTPTGVKTKNLRIATNGYDSTDEFGADIGYYYGNNKWAMNPYSSGFTEAPISAQLKRDLMTIRNAKEAPYIPPGDVNRWLDSISYQDLFTKYYKVSADIMPYVDGLLTTGANGLGGDAASAYMAVGAGNAGSHPYAALTDAWKLLGFKYRESEYPDALYVAPPGGNAALARMLIHKMIPAAFSGPSLNEIWLKPLNRPALDSAESAVRMRADCTVVAVSHEGAPDKAQGVSVWYTKQGVLYRTRAKAVLMATPQQINKHVCRDAPVSYKMAMDTFLHAPVLVVNIGVRNWRFLDKLGISSARWFDGFGWHTGIAKTVQVDGQDVMPCDPDKPAVMTSHVTFEQRGVPAREQATAARMALFGMSYADIEMSIRNQMDEMFSSAGFDSKRDIAAIIANRQGHALPVMPPGFYFGKDGKPAAKEVLKVRFNRIGFCHSELTGLQTWHTAAIMGRKAAQDMLQVT